MKNSGVQNNRWALKFAFDFDRCVYGSSKKGRKWFEELRGPTVMSYQMLLVSFGERVYLIFSYASAIWGLKSSISSKVLTVWFVGDSLLLFLKEIVKKFFLVVYLKMF